MALQIKHKNTFKSKLKKHRSLIPFVIPAVLFALVFSYLPMTGILIAFKDNPNFGRYSVFEAFNRAEWTLDNFKILFSDPEILRYIKNTLIISVMKIVLLFPLPVVLAVMVSEIRNKHFSKLVQGLVFLPHFFFVGGNCRHFQQYFRTVRSRKQPFGCARGRTHLLHG